MSECVEEFNQSLAITGFYVGEGVFNSVLISSVDVIGDCVLDYIIWLKEPTIEQRNTAVAALSSESGIERIAY